MAVMRFATNLDNGVLGMPDSEELWAEIWSHIPEEVLTNKKSRFLFPAIGHGTELKILCGLLKARSWTRRQIINACYIVDKYRVFTNPIKAMGFKNVYTSNFLEWETDMKFDVVVGNPPFQDPDARSSKKLWVEMFERCFSLLYDGGHLALITPASWMAGNGKIYPYFRENRCMYLSTDTSKYFPGIGSTFSSYVLEKGSTPTPVSLTNGRCIDFNQCDMLPRNLDALTIIDKVTEELSPIAIEIDSFCHSQRIERVSKTADKTHTYPIKHGSESLLWSNEPHPAQQYKKVMVYMSGTPKPFFDNGVHGQSQHHAHIKVKSKKQAEALMSYLTSKIVRFFLMQTTYAQAWNKVALKKLSSIDINRGRWTDEELYEYFNLTKEEIDLIESSV